MPHKAHMLTYRLDGGREHTMNKKFYIAYGSNLNLNQMAYRCPTACIYGTGMLLNWTMAFRSMRGPAYATIKPLAGSQVPVVVWKIDRKSENSLDIYEGYPTFYYKKHIEVLMDDKEIIKGMAYIMNRDAILGIPSKSYISSIVQGYVDNNLDLKNFINFTKNI